MIKHIKGWLHRMPHEARENVTFPSGERGCINTECNFRSDIIADFALYVCDESKSDSFNIWRDIKVGMDIWPFCVKCVNKYDDVSMN